jgi:putative nucleotidyltransferase with HDIG domain
VCDVGRDESENAPRNRITDLVDEITVALTNARIYAKDHPRTRSSIESLLRCLDAIRATDASDPIVLGCADGLLFYQKKALLRSSLSSTRVIEALTACRAGALSIDRQAGERDLVALIELWAAKKKDYANVGESNANLLRNGCKAIRFLPSYRNDNLGSPIAASGLLAAVGDFEAPREPIAFDVPVSLYQQTIALLQDSAVRVCHGEDMDMDGARGYVESILSRLTNDAASMMGLARYERYDAYTFGHSMRVCFLALSFAGSLFKNEEMLLRVGLAALMHDIGKARVPFEVLHSTTRLSREERAEMDKHTTHGAEILLGLPDADPLAVATAFSHHQTFDGTGYPITLHPPRQSVGTQIVKICDVYEALTAVRPYKTRMSPIRAYRVMIGMKEHFDPALLRRFIAVNGIYPVGSVVQLSTGERARVLRQSQDPVAPVIGLETEDLATPRVDDSSLVQDLSAGRGPDRPRVVAFLDEDA